MDFAYTYVSGTKVKGISDYHNCIKMSIIRFIFEKSLS